MTNLQLRKLSDGSFFIQYQNNGKAYDASFPTWGVFTDWLAAQVPAPKPQCLAIL